MLLPPASPSRLRALLPAPLFPLDLVEASLLPVLQSLPVMGEAPQAMVPRQVGRKQKKRDQRRRAN
jgi:hypothetical protein